MSAFPASSAHCPLSGVVVREMNGNTAFPLECLQWMLADNMSHIIIRHGASLELLDGKVRFDCQKITLFSFFTHDCILSFSSEMPFSFDEPHLHRRLRFPGAAGGQGG